MTTRTTTLLLCRLLAVLALLCQWPAATVSAAPAPNTVPITLARSDSRVGIRAFWGAPLRLAITSPWQLNGVTELRAEIHAQRVTAGQTPLAVATVANPTGTSASIEFAWNQMCLPLQGQASRPLYLLLRAVNVDGTPDVYELGTITLASSPASDVAAPPPDAVAWATTNSVALKKTKFEAANIAALKTLSTGGAVAGEIALVRGYYAEGDGAEGEFAWDPASTDADDGGMIIQPTGVTTGRWKRVAKLDRVKALWWGLKVNSQDDQTVLIQNILTKVSNAGGGIVELPAGTFKIGIPNQPLRILGSNVTLEGKGRRATILQQTKGLLQQVVVEFGNDPEGLNGTVIRNVTIRDIGFDLNNNRSAKGIRLRYPVDGVIIENCDCWNSPLENNTEPYHFNGDDHFIDMSVRVAAIRNLWIRGCRVMYAVQLTSNAGGGVDGLYIIDNLIQDPYAYGVAITGILRDPGFRIENVHISGNTFRNVAHGINIGRDQTANFEVQMVNDQQVVKNITIDNNLFIVGGVYGASSSNGISVNTYQNEISGVRISNNIVRLGDDQVLGGQVGIQVAVYEFNWLPTHHGGVAPVISAVDTATDIITTDKAHYLFNNMQVRFEPATRSDVLPSPLITNRRYLIQLIDDFRFKLTDMRTGATINLGSTFSGTVKVLFSPAIRDIEVDGNTVTGFSEAIRVNGACGVGVRNNRCNGSIYFSPASVCEDAEITNNVVTKGGITSLGSVINGRMFNNSVDSNDAYFTAGNVRLFNMAPSVAVWDQDWYVKGNTANLVRPDGNNIFRVVSGFAANLGPGRVTLWDFDGNSATSNIPRPFDDLLGSNVMMVRDGTNFVRNQTPTFTPSTSDFAARFLSSLSFNPTLKEVQADAEASAKQIPLNALILEGRTSTAQAVSTLTGVNFGSEGRAVEYRHRVSGKANILQGLWALSDHATLGHRANCLYAFEKDGILTIRQVGATAGAMDSTAGTVVGGDYIQAVVDMSARRSLPTHTLITIDRTGVLAVYVEGIPVSYVQTTSGTAPVWNNASLPANPSLHIGFFDTAYNTFEGAFYSVNIHNYAPTQSQAQDLFAGGTSALPAYGLRTPIEKVVNGTFDSATGWTLPTSPADVAITGGVAVFTNTATGSGISQNPSSADYRKGRMYRLKFRCTAYTSGTVYFNLGTARLATQTPAAGTDYFFEALSGDSANSLFIRSFDSNGNFSIDNVSIIQIGCVASYDFTSDDCGIGYWVEDKSDLQNHMFLATTSTGTGAAGAGWHKPRSAGSFYGKFSGNALGTGDGGYIGRNGYMMPTGHILRRIKARSVSGGTITLGEAQTTNEASLVASVNLTAGAWTELTLLKTNSGANRIFAHLGTATDVQVWTYYEDPRQQP